MQKYKSIVSLNDKCQLTVTYSWLISPLFYVNSYGLAKIILVNFCGKNIMIMTFMMTIMMMTVIIIIIIIKMIVIIIMIIIVMM